MKFLHTPETYARDRVASASLAYWRSKTVDAILASFVRDPLVVRTSDGLIMNGNTRALVLLERGYDITLLPRITYP